MKIGVELKIDVTKIEKARLYKGQKGTYLTMTAFIDLEEKDQYGNSGMITHEKKEGEDRSPILGNSKIFWSDSQQPQQNNAPQQQQDTRYNQAPQQQQNNAPQKMAPPIDDLSDDAIPF